MMKSKKQKTVAAVFIAALVVVVLLVVVSIIKTNAYNAKHHTATFSGTELFTDAGKEVNPDVYVTGAARTSTWTKVFDFKNEGLTDHNYQAYTYDFTVTNGTKDEVSEFTFKLTFSEEAYLMSAWNGGLEIHQMVAGGELVDTVPDLREFDPSQHSLAIVTVDGESLIAMKAGDYLVYHPSTSQNAMEMPIEPYEGTTPGIILYTEIGTTIEESSLELEYTFHRALTSEPLFWVSLAVLALWLIALVIYEITSAQIKKYQERHERDNEIINESIETLPASSTRRTRTPTVTPSGSRSIRSRSRRSLAMRVRSSTASITSPCSTTAERSACRTTFSENPAN